MVCEGMWGNSCGGRERYVGEWREEVVEVGEWVGEVGGGGKEGWKKRDIIGREEKGEGDSGDGKGRH